jgi:hypothetical protein
VTVASGTGAGQTVSDVKPTGICAGTCDHEDATASTASTAKDPQASTFVWDPLADLQSLNTEMGFWNDSAWALLKRLNLYYEDHIPFEIDGGGILFKRDPEKESCQFDPRFIEPEHISTLKIGLSNADHLIPKLERQCGAFTNELASRFRLLKSLLDQIKRWMAVLIISPIKVLPKFQLVKRMKGGEFFIKSDFTIVEQNLGYGWLPGVRTLNSIILKRFVVRILLVFNFNYYLA